MRIEIQTAIILPMMAEKKIVMHKLLYLKKQGFCFVMFLDIKEKNTLEVFSV